MTRVLRVVLILLAVVVTATIAQAQTGYVTGSVLQSSFFDTMIPIASLQKTAEQLMAKAAIEIPDDYLDGLRACANTEKGDLFRLLDAPKNASWCVGGDPPNRVCRPLR